MSGIIGSRFNTRGSGLIGSLGTDGQVFTSSGTGAGAVFETVSAGSTLVAEAATTSGSNVTFTGIPSGTKAIWVMFDEVSTDAYNTIGVQIGDSGGLETSGYYGACGGTLIVAANTTNFSASFMCVNVEVAGNKYSGLVELRLQNSSDNNWVMSGAIGTASGGWDGSGGFKTLSGELTQVSVFADNTFDYGMCSIQYM